MKETAGCGRHENETNIFAVSVHIMTGFACSEGHSVGFRYKSIKREKPYNCGVLSRLFHLEECVPVKQPDDFDCDSYGDN